MGSSGWAAPCAAVALLLAGCLGGLPARTPLASGPGEAGAIGLTAFATAPPVYEGPLQVILLWQVPEAAACPTSTSIVQRLGAHGQWDTIHVLHGPRPSMAARDYTVAHNETSTYRVKVANCAVGDAVGHATVRVMLPPAPAPPAQTDDGERVVVSWTPVTDPGSCGGVAAYRVHRAAVGGARVLAATVASPGPVPWPAPYLQPLDFSQPPPTQWRDEAVPAALGYRHNYTVSAITCVGEGPASNASTPPPRPPVPVNTAGDPDLPTLAWPTSAKDWLGALNAYRASAGLPPVTEDPGLTATDRLHVSYLLRNNASGHEEDPALPGYSDAGHAAGLASNVIALHGDALTARRAIDLWMAAPFHGLAMVDPSLERVGFALDQEGPKVRAALNVLDGRTGSTAGLRFPVAWPGDGAVVPLDRYPGNEDPEPLTSCQGYTAPAGLPVLVQFAEPTVLLNHSFHGDGVELEHCVFDATTYTNPSAADQQRGRAILEGRNAAVLVPRALLEPGVTYTVSLTHGDGAVTTWSFQVTAQA